MNIWRGKAVCGGIAIGTASVYRQSRENAEKTYATDWNEEREKYAKVKTLAIDELDKLFKRAKNEIGEKEAQIFSIHKMMVEDEYYNQSVLNIIEKQKMNAETAVLMTSDNFERLFHNMENAYMRERASDIRDVSDRIVALLKGKKRILPSAATENTIIFASNLAPSEALQMDKSKILAFVTEGGSDTSHTAILARSLRIPAVCGIKISGKIDGKRVAVDGYTGTVYIDPDEKTIEKLKNKGTKQNLQAKTADGTAVTKSGKRVRVLANICVPEEIKNAGFCDFDGVGMFGSEVLFGQGNTFPSEEYQFDAYRKILEGTSELRIRTLDIDADKKGTFFGIFGEENPAMGMRSIRICLKYPQILKTQLRAILKASACGKVKILLPMVTSADEVMRVKKLLDVAKGELRSVNVKFDENIGVGIVIETPASAVISDDLAKLCDFFLIDTNSLTQYMLAMDRKNIALSELFDRHHKAVMKMIEYVAGNAHKNGITAGICGDLATDTDKTAELLKMGIDEFSVTPKRVYEIKKAICDSE